MRIEWMYRMIGPALMGVPALMAVADANLPSGTPLPQGAIGWWAGEDDARDRMGLHHGAVRNGATFAPGVVGQAFHLDGVDDFIEIPDSQGLDFHHAFTLEAWIRPDRRGFMRMIQCVRDGVGINLITDTDGVLCRFNIDDGPTDYDAFSATPLSVGKFQHIACTFDGATMKLYINGSLEATTPASPHPEINAALHLSNTDIPFKGLIDEVCIYNRALSESEIKSIYTAGSSGKWKPLPGK